MGEVQSENDPPRRRCTTLASRVARRAARRDSGRRAAGAGVLGAARAGTTDLRRQTLYRRADEVRVLAVGVAVAELGAEPEVVAICVHVGAEEAIRLRL